MRMQYCIRIAILTAKNCPTLPRLRQEPLQWTPVCSSTNSVQDYAVTDGNMGSPQKSNPWNIHDGLKRKKVEATVCCPATRSRSHDACYGAEQPIAFLPMMASREQQRLRLLRTVRYFPPSVAAGLIVDDYQRQDTSMTCTPSRVGCF